MAIEKDRTLAAYLRQKFSHQANLEVIEGDALKMAIPEGWKVVSSPPYNISSKLVLLIMKSKFQSATLLLQEEFVQRLTAPSGSREYGRISVMLQSRAESIFDSKVSRNAFYPRPRVGSAIITIRPPEKSLFIKNQELFTDLVRALFTQRRRKLRTVLKKYLSTRFPLEIGPLLQNTTIPEKRIYQMEPYELATLSNQISDATREPGRE